MSAGGTDLEDGTESGPETEEATCLTTGTEAASEGCVTGPPTEDGSKRGGAPAAAEGLDLDLDLSLEDRLEVGEG